MRKISVLVATVALFCIPQVSDAGLKSKQPVWVHEDWQGTGSGSAYGYLGNTYNSSDDDRYILCSLHAEHDSPELRIFCSALGYGPKDVVWERACTSYPAPPSLVSALAAATDSGWLEFAWDKNGTCTEIHTVVSSTGNPKVHP